MRRSSRSCSSPRAPSRHPVRFGSRASPAPCASPRATPPRSRTRTRRPGSPTASRPAAKPWRRSACRCRCCIRSRRCCSPRAVCNDHTPMEYRQLGRSGLRVSTLTLGTMTFGGQGAFAKVGDTGVDGARRQIDMALDAGVNCIDTADVYSAGVSEEIVGEVLEGRREQVVLATKARMSMGDGANDAGLSRTHLIKSVEASLRRLRTDYIDLYQVHEWDGQTPLEETLDTLD